MIIDIIVIAALLVSAVIAYLRGFIREVLTIIGVIGGLIAAVYGAPLLKPLFRDWLGVGEGRDAAEKAEKLFDLIPYSTVADALAYGTIFILVVIVLSLLSHWLSGAAKEHGLGPVDRTLGAMFGLVRGLLLLALLYLPVHLLADKETKESWFRDSVTHFYIEWTADEIAAMLPDSEENLKVSSDQKDEFIRGAREKLQNMNFSGQEGEAGQDGDTAAPAADGYRQQERRKLDTLFEDEEQKSENE